MVGTAEEHDKKSLIRYRLRMLKLWNTLHRQLEDFKPISDKAVGLYTCGPTVYNPVTIGNWRAFLFDDLIARSLRFLDYKVDWVMNITDVGHLVGDGDTGEDKVEREAGKRGVNAYELARSLEADFLQGMDRLNIKRPDHLPRATENIPEQIAIIHDLENKGFTYKTSDGIYFDTSKFKAYGQLSGQKLEDKEAGARVEINPEKRNPTDFALWKFSPTDAKRQMEWPSPWGMGFPGWHIECSAMSVKYLGQPFDIHAGGIDHIPVHHENEIAQSEAAYDRPLANYWLHNEFLLVDGKRMGKSEGNAYTLDDLIAKGFDPLAYRYYCLGTHYRSKMNFTWEGLEGAQNAFRKLQGIARGLDVGAQFIAPTGVINHAPTDFIAALEEDLNTSKALSVMWEMLGSDLSAEEKSAMLLEMDAVLGLGLKDIIGKKIDAPLEIKLLADQRLEVRKNKDWAKSDELRDLIKSKGWMVEDKKDGYELTPVA